MSRRLRDLIELVAANVYFAPEAQNAYQELGLDYLSGYFCSRGGCMGQVPGEVVVAAFGVFNPGIVIPAVEQGWEKTDAPTILAARQGGATESLRRILGDQPAGVDRATELLRRAGDAATGEGRPLFSGLRSLGFPGEPIGDLWRASDLLREHRGDSHIAAWVAAGVDAVEITVLTELWWGLPLNSYVRTRGWSGEEIDAAIARLRERGLVKDDEFTPEGEELRAAIEAATDTQERSIVAALGDDAEELFGILTPYADAILAAGGYPSDPRTMTRP
ncbi:MAG: SCO6745 family protein [Actinomycetota bacterium]